MKKIIILCFTIIFIFTLISCGSLGANSAGKVDDSAGQDKDEMEGYTAKSEKDSKRLEALKEQIEGYIGFEFAGNLVSVDCGMQKLDGTEPTDEYDFSKVRIEIQFQKAEDAVLLYEYLMNEDCAIENDMARSRYELNDNVVVMTVERINND